MSDKYLIYYPKTSVRDEWLHALMDYANKTKIGIVSNLLPIIGNLSVSENILIAAYYHRKLTFTEGVSMVQKDLDRFGIGHHINSRSNQLNDFERLIVKYLQVRYLCSEWIVFLSPRRMYVAEYEERFHEFLRCEDLDKSVIIEHESNRGLYKDMTEYNEKGFKRWLTQDLKI